MIASDQRVAAVRRFNRFYTQKIGVLQERLSRSPFSLTAARVLYEIAHRKRSTASEIGATLGLDAGYLSRIIAAFSKEKLVQKSVSKEDSRKSHLRLTLKGRRAFERLNKQSHEDVAGMIALLPAADQKRLVDSMDAIESMLAGKSEDAPSFEIRAHRPGDMGWVVQRHGELYAKEYDWDAEFEALVAEIVAKFIRNLDPSRERCWIAHRRGENLGCVFLVAKSATVAQLRLLLVDPAARGFGIGRRLVDECIRFARGAGYRRMILWTNDVLHAARHIYEANGFRLVEEEKHHSFGHDLVGQTWELKL